MKKIIVILLTICSLLAVTSCDTYAQATVYDDGFVYEYSYNSHPVRYVDGIAYYYCFHNNLWGWILLDRIYYNRIVRHPRPVRYIHPHYYHGRYYNRHNRPHPIYTYPGRGLQRPYPGRGTSFTTPSGRFQSPSNNASFGRGGFGGRR